MDTARIAALLEPFLEQPLASSQLDQISTYIDLLQRWNARINLTAIRHEEEIVTRHFGESFFLARHLFPTPCHPERSEDMRKAHVFAESKACPEPSRRDPYLSTTAGAPLIAHIAMSGLPLHPPRVLDIGSGAGFPALPLKIWAPNIHLTLIESNHKKAVFLREVTRALTLTNVDVIADRAETLAASQDFPRADVVTLRAVEHFEAILPQAVTLLATNGSLALLIGTSQVPHLTTLTTIKWNPTIHIPKSQTRVLSIGVQAKSGS
jgi:16S rRNA (guanine527-N7)-methyltransferase